MASTYAGIIGDRSWCVTDDSSRIYDNLNQDNVEVCWLSAASDDEAVQELEDKLRREYDVDCPPGSTRITSLPWLREGRILLDELHIVDADLFLRNLKKKPVRCHMSILQRSGIYRGMKLADLIRHTTRRDYAVPLEHEVLAEKTTGNVYNVRKVTKQEWEEAAKIILADPGIRDKTLRRLAEVMQDSLQKALKSKFGISSIKFNRRSKKRPGVNWTAWETKASRS